LRLAGFQRQVIETLYDSRAAVVSLPAGNGKTTLLAAIALERICRGDDYVEVDVVATKQEQAGFLVEAAKRMVEASPALVPLCAFASDSGTLDYRVTGSRLRAHPAKLSSVQGLNFSLAVIDEIGFAADDVVASLIARVGKRPDAAVIGIGTPGLEPNVMFRMRERAAELGGIGFRYLEWSAPAGCEIGDRSAWRSANPAMRAGFLNPEAMAIQAALMTEAEFRVYHLGQWVTVSGGSWLPPGVWDACPMVDAPPEGTEVVLGLAGTWSSSVAVVGATIDGALFVAWASDTATDDELAAVFQAAAEQWQVVEVVVAPRQRANLIPVLVDAGLAVEVWPNRLDVEVSSATEWRRAIMEGRVAHDHHPVLGKHVTASAARSTSDGSLRLVPPDDGRPVDAARAARMAWWRVTDPDAVSVPAIY
jgi:phage terminase large subunit-like protein